ncbi:hypothetical protein HRE53_26230 (plasmid) [Acaryochloris sp. 'Moss Beach']|uniref:hypothetical protein n=1 Tax=Acaryochloris sp. 'Moss Beach' TaxID=2740837 RepID=UPI001F1BF3C9|nr:hypothetical protein [Acaryochloris sp. 'Moss Beach']UJB72415.1 hypothetical protein HRE53_26230 [Acaryochloris sp. 'Moss Beach']
MQTKARMPTRIRLRDWCLEKKAGVYLLKTPLMTHCCSCRQYRLAIAAMPTGNSERSKFKWFCPRCAQKFGLSPTQELLRKLPTMNTLRVQERRERISQFSSNHWITQQLSMQQGDH